MLELKSYSEEHLLAITKEFSSIDRNSVRNIPSYLLGIMRKVPAPYTCKIFFLTFLFILFLFIINVNISIFISIAIKNISNEDRFPAKRPLDYYVSFSTENIILTIIFTYLI